MPTVYILTRRNQPPNYDVNNVVMVVAGTPREARRLAANVARDEGKDTWLDAKQSTCKIANLKVKGVVMCETRDG
jgi:hypothetical protein